MSPSSYPYWVLGFKGGLGYVLLPEYEYAAREAPILGPPPDSPPWAPTPWRSGATRFFSLWEARDKRLELRYPLDGSKPLRGLRLIKVRRKKTP